MTLLPTAKLLHVLAKLSEPVPKKPRRGLSDRKLYMRQYMRGYRKREHLSGLDP